jgi:hypothetical protein
VATEVAGERDGHEQSAPLKTGLTHALAPDRVNPLTLAETNSTPMMVPITLKKPGTTAVAPRNAAASAGKSRLVAAPRLL